MHAKQVIQKCNFSPPDERYPSHPHGPTAPAHILGTVSYGMEYPFGQFCQLSQLCPLPTSHAPGRPEEHEQLISPGAPSNRLQHQ